jgi:predicted DNA-binding transcriptional regulator YafY
LLQVGNRYEYDVKIDRVVEPYGLVSKGGVWYLVSRYKGYYGTHRLSSIHDVLIMDETFERQADFDLAAYWKEWCQSFVDNLPDYPVRVRISPDLIPHLPRLFGTKIQDAVEEALHPDNDEWLTLTLYFETFYQARERILGLGGAIEVLEPRALRCVVADLAAQTLSLYQ